jgi:hypothetical protein
MCPADKIICITPGQKKWSSPKTELGLPFIITNLVYKFQMINLTGT